MQQDVERFRRECEERGFDPAELMRGMTTRDVPEKTALFVGEVRNSARKRGPSSARKQ